MEAWIIDHIKQQEQKRRQQEEAARLHVPTPRPPVTYSEEGPEVKRDWNNWY